LLETADDVSQFLAFFPAGVELSFILKLCEAEVDIVEIVVAVFEEIGVDDVQFVFELCETCGDGLDGRIMS
jgi:hypothetical protein